MQEFAELIALAGALWVAEFAAVRSLRFFAALELRRRPRSERECIACVRAHMRAFGHDLDHLTDEELKAGLAEGVRLYAAAGITCSEAAAALGGLAVYGRRDNGTGGVIDSHK